MTFNPYQDLIDNVVSQYGEYHTYPVGSQTEEDDTEGAHKIFAPMPTPNSIYRRATVGLSSLVSGNILEELNDIEYLTQKLTTVITAFEMKHSTSLSPRFVKETIDGTHTRRTGDNCLYTRLTYGPTTHIEGLWWTFPHAESNNPNFRWMIPPQWIALRDNQINVLPDFGVFYGSSTGINHYVRQFPILRNLNRRVFNPSEWYIKYRYGYSYDKIPAPLVELITLRCIASILEEMAGVILPVSGMSTQIDGVSQSVNTAGKDILLQKAELINKQANELEQNVMSSTGDNIVIDFIE